MVDFSFFSRSLLLRLAVLCYAVWPRQQPLSAVVVGTLQLLAVPQVANCGSLRVAARQRGRLLPLGLFLLSTNSQLLGSRTPP